VAQRDRCPEDFRKPGHFYQFNTARQFFFYFTRPLQPDTIYPICEKKITRVPHWPWPVVTDCFCAFRQAACVAFE
jgi:hypothetical protein